MTNQQKPHNSAAERGIALALAVAVVVVLMVLVLNPRAMDSGTLAIVRFLAALCAGLSGYLFSGTLGLEARLPFNKALIRATGGFAAFIAVFLLFYFGIPSSISSPSKSPQPSSQAPLMNQNAGAVSPQQSSNSTPGTTPSSASDETIQTQVWRSVTLELKSCVRGTRNIVNCTLSLSNSENSQFGINVCPDTKLVDSSGNEYHSDKVQVVNSVGSGCNNLFFAMAQGAHYKTTVEFTDVPTEISEVVLLQINSPYGVVAQYQNVSIN